MVFVRTLGAASIDAGATHLTPASVRKFALLLYLWAERGRSVTRATLHDLIFPDQTAPNARHSIRELVYQFRKFGARIASSGETVELAPDSVRADVSDVVRQERPSLDQLRAAQGGLLPGYAPAHSEAFTEWLESFRARTIADLNRVFVAELGRARRLGDWSVAEAAAQAILALDPLHEEATLATAEMLAMGGAKAQAVRLLDKYQEEVGSSPDLKVQATLLRRRINERSRELYRPPLTLPFLGRDAEMSALQERFALARAGEPQCVALVGEAGIGKTRLAEELCTQAVLAGAGVERIATQPHDTHRPMATFADLVPKLLELPGALGCSPESILALRRLTKQDSEIAGRSEANSEVIAAAIGRAISDLIDSLANEAPLLLFVDDAQWIDERSRQTLATLTSVRHARRLMIVVTSRDQALLQFFAQRSERALGLTLSPLTNRSSRELTDRALGDSIAADEELQAWIASSSGGNPFFLKCLIGHFGATGERFVVPASISILLDQKVAALSCNARALLQICVVLGRHSEIERILAALEMPQIDLQLAAAELEARNLIIHAGRRIDPAHSLVAETVGRLTSPVVSRLINRRVALVLQAEAQASDSSALLWDCAEHWAIAGEEDRAADFLERCSTRAIEIGRPREAAELLLRAAAMVNRDRAIRLARSSVEIADTAHEGDIVKQAIGLLRRLNVPIEADPIELAELHALVCEWENSAYASQRLSQWVASNAPIGLRIRAAIEMVVVAENERSEDLARRLYEALFADLEAQNGTDGGDFRTLMALLIYHCSFGVLERAREIAEHLIELAPKVSDAIAADIYRKCGVAFWRLGLTNGAINALERSYHLAKKVGLLKLQMDTAIILAGIYLDQDEGHSMGPWIDIIAALATESPELRSRPGYVLLHLDVSCSVGNYRDARKWLDLGIDQCDGNSVGIFQRWIRAADFRVRQMEDRPASPDTAKQLVGHHLPDRENGDIGDFEVAVALEFHRQRGELEEAHRLLAEYFGRNRRSKNPPCLSLRRAVRGLPFDTECLVNGRAVDFMPIAYAPLAAP
jgi:DNA-binding SARP family transcriptional activator